MQALSTPDLVPCSLPHYPTPQKTGSGVEIGRVGVLRVALPSKSKREQSGLYKSSLKVHYFFLPLKLLILGLKKKLHENFF